MPGENPTYPTVGDTLRRLLEELPRVWEELQQPDPTQRNSHRYDENAVQFVAMATPEDLKANAEFIKLADAYVEVPAGKNSNNYANIDVITSVAKVRACGFFWWVLELVSLRKL